MRRFYAHDVLYAIAAISFAMSFGLIHGAPAFFLIIGIGAFAAALLAFLTH